MTPDLLLVHFDRISDAPDAVPRLRRFILDLAVRGKLVEQDPNDEAGSELLTTVRAEVRRRKNGRKDKESDIDRLLASDAPFALPANWTWGRLGELCEKTGSGSTPRGGRSTYQDHGVPFLRSQNVYNDGLRLNDVAYIDDHTHRRMEGTAVKPGDLLLNITGGSIGRCCRVPDGFGEANISQHVAIIRVALAGLQDYLHRLVSSPYFQSYIFDEQTGAGRGGLPKNKMDRIPVALPPLAEQHRIVAKMDELMGLCDRLEGAQIERESRRDRLNRASLHRLNNVADADAFRDHARFHLRHLPRLTTRPEHIQQLRRTILNLAVRGKLVPQDPKNEPASELIKKIDEEREHAIKAGLLGKTRPPIPIDESQQPTLPSNWKWVRIADILFGDSQNGYSRKPDDAPDGIPILRISAGTVRKDGLVAEEEHKLIGGTSQAVRQQYELQSGDLLACRFNGNRSSVGRLSLYTGYLGMNPIYPDKLIRLRLFSKLVLPELVRYFAESEIVRNDVVNYCATTVGNWGISASNLKQVKIPIPPLAEQHRIVAKVDELMKLCDQLESQLTTTQTESRRLLEAILHEALAPASVGQEQNA